jgi:demethylmenaquinone methyltransferase/2-methoxy-6-polyprenyl-1,4-benzoquinol methylase
LHLKESSAATHGAEAATTPFPDNMPSAKDIREMFDSIAPEYDAFNHLTSLGIDRCWRRRALRFIKGPKVLDLACGTGDFSIAIARGLRGVHVTGIDISDGMLAEMKLKLARAGLDSDGTPLNSNSTPAGSDGTPLSRVSALIGDACNLQFPNETFDSVSVAFGVRNFEDKEKALSEALRVLKPGGHFVMLELGLPDKFLARKVFNLYFKYIMPYVGGKMSRNKEAYRYLPESVSKFPEKSEWMATMESTGFRNVRHRAFSLGICRLYTGEK